MVETICGKGEFWAWNEIINANVQRLKRFRHSEELWSWYQPTKRHWIYDHVNNPYQLRQSFMFYSPWLVLLWDRITQQVVKVWRIFGRVECVASKKLIRLRWWSMRIEESFGGWIVNDLLRATDIFQRKTACWVPVQLLSYSRVMQQYHMLWWQIMHVFTRYEYRSEPKYENWFKLL